MRVTKSFKWCANFIGNQIKNILPNSKEINFPVFVEASDREYKQRKINHIPMGHLYIQSRTTISTCERELDYRLLMTLLVALLLIEKRKLNAAEKNNNFVDKIIDKKYDTNENLEAKDSTFNKDVRARDEIYFERVTAKGTVISSMGGIKAIDSVLNKIQSRDDSELINTSAKIVKISMGGLTWKKSQ